MHAGRCERERGALVAFLGLEGNLQCVLVARCVYTCLAVARGVFVHLHIYRGYPRYVYIAVTYAHEHIYPSKNIEEPMAVLSFHP